MALIINGHRLIRAFASADFLRCHTAHSRGAAKPRIRPLPSPIDQGGRQSLAMTSRLLGLPFSFGLAIRRRIAALVDRYLAFPVF